MTIIIDSYVVPEKGKVELNVKQSFEIKVTAEEARRQVDRWLLNDVSHMMGAKEPILVIGEHVVWRVSAWFSAPGVGQVGKAGTVDVDVNTGAMNNTPECKAEIIRRAEALAVHLPPYQPKKSPEQYLAQNVPAAPKLRILKDGSLAPPTEKATI